VPEISLFIYLFIYCKQDISFRLSLVSWNFRFNRLL